jgi:ATP-dependent DNA helicase RecG
MQLSLEKLHKFFRLEAERGYDNRAVVGGLDKILPAWEAEARADSLSEDLIREVLGRLGRYPDLEPEERAGALKDLWKYLQSSNHIPESSGQLPDLANVKPRPHPELPPASQPQQKHHQRREDGDKHPEANRVVQRPPKKSDRNAHPQPEGPAGLGAALTVLVGIGPRHAETLAQLGLHTLGDLLYYFPRRYDDYSQLKPIGRLDYGQEVTVIASVQSVTNRTVRGGQAQITEAIVTDGSGYLRVTWFNQPWMASRLRANTLLSLSGKVDQYLGRLVMNSPEWEPLDQEQLHTNRIVPVYPLTASITQRWLRRIMFQTVSYWAPRVSDYLPESVRSSAGLTELPTALRQIHFPENQERLKAARERLAFDEIFFLQLGVLRQKRHWQSGSAEVFSVGDDWLGAQVARLPFPLTGAQQRALDELRRDLASGRPMNRLLQGDVGSGKTVIAALGIAMVASGDAQAALMAPTSILAEQHYRTLLRLLASDGREQPAPMLPEQIRLLVGDTSETEKEDIRQGLLDGRIRLVVGTHALIEDPVAFQRLRLAVIDEQHRFGVEQRSRLRAKGENPHLLVMTATPIPRSLALTVYGDLDLSVMDEMPAGRQQVSTHILSPRERERAYRLVIAQVEQGRQAFFIYPLVEQGEREETRAAVEEYTRLQNVIFPRFKLGLLHGRLRPEEKDAVMARFRDGEIDILVSTSVVEVGVDVPNATVMVIEGANRFGLAQLHQFRGRVGRGSEQSYCLLIPETEDALENERLAVMVETNDGFVLAERDLQQRGPGEFLGSRQSGFNDLRLASLTDVRLIEKARNQAQVLFENDPDLQAPENQALLNSLQHYWGEGKGDVS